MKHKDYKSVLIALADYNAVSEYGVIATIGNVEMHFTDDTMVERLKQILSKYIDDFCDTIQAEYKKGIKTQPIVKRIYSELTEAKNNIAKTMADIKVGKEECLGINELSFNLAHRVCEEYIECLEHYNQIDDLKTSTIKRKQNEKNLNLNIDNNKLGKYFNNKFRGIGQEGMKPIDRFILHLEREADRNNYKRKDLGCVAVLIMESENFMAKNLSFAEWFRTFMAICGIDGLPRDLAKNKYKPNQKHEYLKIYL